MSRKKERKRLYQPIWEALRKDWEEKFTKIGGQAIGVVRVEVPTLLVKRFAKAVTKEKDMDNWSVKQFLKMETRVLKEEKDFTELQFRLLQYRTGQLIARAVKNHNLDATVNVSKEVKDKINSKYRKLKTMQELNHEQD